MLFSIGLKLSANAASNIINIIKNSETEFEIHTSVCIGIDDFAFRKGLNYATIICNLKTHKVIDILENRDSSTIESWLK
ncbi:transposase [Tepidibacter formicigenes]|uniref:transposase n=1 Tax=Tepidibacter formicigenes TaxID=227138 RepID=UPI0009FD65D7